MRCIGCAQSMRPRLHGLASPSALSLAPPPPAPQVVEHDLVSPAGRDDLPVAPAQRPIRPPAILDQPGLADGVDLATVDRQRAAVRRRPTATRRGHRRGTARPRGLRHALIARVTLIPRMAPAPPGARGSASRDRPPARAGRIGAGGGTRLADRFSQACRPGRGGSSSSAR